ncbi:cytochrome C oxidase subunit IV family protein [Falsibacillus albus]|uniref:Cytochrome C oxidase subunit IV n=1 Tax=Falsibacillus albus TaxID=2478915 RepID=A0A3L7K0W8_9BACI|nr:cytochrome C oxidase subunit IV family protein [Falsibacillus albus]RLQ96727.1 hypothetical protein D9X91_06385 [Falsibacillus albus]
MDSTNLSKWRYYLSFAIMILFSAFAFYLTSEMKMIITPGRLMTVLLLMAFIQAGIQFIIFMHIFKTQKWYRIIALSSGGMVAALTILFLWLLQ